MVRVRNDANLRSSVADREVLIALGLQALDRDELNSLVDSEVPELREKASRDERVSRHVQMRDIVGNIQRRVAEGRIVR